MNRSTPLYDAAVIGGGHNGLSAACYLASDGKKAVLIEALGKVVSARASDDAGRVTSGKARLSSDGTVTGVRVLGSRWQLHRFLARLKNGVYDAKAHYNH